MKMIDDVIIIGIDSGYGNIKTANCCFPASVSAYDKEPVFKENLLVYESKFYLIGEGHKEFLADKTRDLDYYVLALAAIARELNIRKMTCGKIRIAAGLPLTWVSGQRDEFRDYLLQNKAVDFSFRNVSYHSALPPQTSARRVPKSSRHRRNRRTRTFLFPTEAPRKRTRRKPSWMRFLPLRPIRRRRKRKTPRKARLRNPVRPSLHQISARKPSGVSLIQRNAPAHLSGRK